jgi:hypothetical protein
MKNEAAMHAKVKGKRTEIWMKEMASILTRENAYKVVEKQGNGTVRRASWRGMNASRRCFIYKIWLMQLLTLEMAVRKAHLSRLFQYP